MALEQNKGSRRPHGELLKEKTEKGTTERGKTDKAELSREEERKQGASSSSSARMTDRKRNSIREHTDFPSDEWIASYI